MTSHSDCSELALTIAICMGLSEGIWSEHESHFLFGNECQFHQITYFKRKLSCAFSYLVLMLGFPLPLPEGSLSAAKHPDGKDSTQWFAFTFPEVLMAEIWNLFQDTGDHLPPLHESCDSCTIFKVCTLMVSDETHDLRSTRHTLMQYPACEAPIQQLIVVSRIEPRLDSSK